jgi:hypothetical protein
MRTYKMSDESSIFDDNVTVLDSLFDYRAVKPRSPMLYYSPQCGHCTRFASTYSKWASQLKYTLPGVRVYALDLSKISSNDVAVHATLFPNDKLPEYVPVMSLTSGPTQKRVIWSKEDGDKTVEGLTQFLLRHRRFHENHQYTLEGGGPKKQSHSHRNKKEIMSPHKQSSSPKKKRSPSRWAKAVAKAYRVNKITEFTVMRKTGSPSSAGRQMYDAVKRIYNEDAKPSDVRADRIRRARKH